MWRMGLGGILADEMGLGKTIQVIALLSAIRESEEAEAKAAAAKAMAPNAGCSEAGVAERRPHLFVVPVSTMDQWMRELSVWAPQLVAVRYHGSQQQRGEMQRELDSMGDDDAGGFGADVVLTTYTYFEGDHAASRFDRKWLGRRQWGLLVLDEAHALRKQESKRYARLRRIDARQRLLLTGTPVQNRLPELLSLLSFMLPATFPPELSPAFEMISSSAAASHEGKAAAGSTEAAQLMRARRLLAPFVLRRRKQDVLTQLVAKREFEEHLEMTTRQAEVHASVLARAQSAHRGDKGKGEAKGKGGGTSQRGRAKGKGNGKKHNDDGDDASMATPSFGKDAASLFASMRRAANHPCLLRSAWYSPDDLERIAQYAYKAHHFGEQARIGQVRSEIASYSDYKLHTVCAHVEGLTQHMLPPSVLLDSAKFARLRLLLPKLKAEGHRVLIFSQFLEMLDLLEYLLGPAGLKMRQLRIDGSTPAAERQSRIDAFQKPGSKVFAFLLSTRAGGQGINLTAADTVIMHDLDWNPALDRQAEDRAHRIGQTRDVSVYRFVTAGTVEESILTLQQRKKDLGDSVLDADPSSRPSSRQGDAQDEELHDELHDLENSGDGGKLDSAKMSALIEHALSLVAASPRK